MRTAPETTAAPAIMEEGDVLGSADGIYKVACREETIRAKRAFGCLVDPCEGDRAALYRTAQGEWFILSVLERRGGEDACLSCKGDLSLRSESGSLSLSAPERVEVEGESLLLTAARTRLRSGEMDLEAPTLRVKSIDCDVSAHAWRITGSTLDATFEEISETAKRSQRTAAETATLQAGCLSLQADTVFHVQSEFSVLNADKTTKIDADQIHMG